MDTSQLRSAISSLERECYQQERENEEIRRDIGAICTGLSLAAVSVARTCTSADQTLRSSTEVLAYSDRMLAEVSAEQEHIKFLYRGFKNVETANKRIRELTNKIYYEFANFRMVRKIVRAFIDNINLDMVKEELIYKSVEKEHLQSPDFWLSCSMLAIMHWKNDEHAAADRAIAQAMELDARQTILFFMSFNLLMGRRDAALKWFLCYRDLKKTGDDAEFVLLLLHATNLREEEKDPFTKAVKDFLIKAYAESASMNDTDVMVELVKDHLVQYNTSESFVFDTLRNYLKDYHAMSNVLSMAKDNEAILALVETTNCAPRTRGTVFVERFIGQLLDTPDKKERQYTDEIAYNEEIIRCVGDLGKAEESFKEKHEHATSPLNLMSECVGWLFGARASECSELAKSNMFILCRELIRLAAEKYFREYRSAHKTTHPAAIKDYTTQMNFKDKAGEMKKAEDFYENKKNAQLATVKNTAMILCIVLAALCAVGAVASLIGGIYALMGVLLVAAAALGVGAFLVLRGNKRKREEIIAANDAALQNVKQIIERLFSEFGDYLKAYEDCDRVSEDVLFAIKR